MKSVVNESTVRSGLQVLHIPPFSHKNRAGALLSDTILLSLFFISSPTIDTAPSFLLLLRNIDHADEVPPNDQCLRLIFYPADCVSTHAVVLCDMNGRQMPLSPAPTSSSVPLGLIRRGYVSHRYIGPSVTP